MSVTIRVCSVRDVEPGTALRVSGEGEGICVVRIDDDWYAVGDRCTHQDISLAEGEVLTEERQIECWKHGSCFSLVTGEPDSLPATKPVPVYEVRLDGDDVYVVVT